MEAGLPDLTIGVFEGPQRGALSLYAVLVVNEAAVGAYSNLRVLLQLEQFRVLFLAKLCHLTFFVQSHVQNLFNGGCVTLNILNI